MKRIPLLLLIAVLLCASLDGQSPDLTGEYVPGEVIIQFQSDATPEARAEARQWVGGARRQLLRRAASGELELARVPSARIDQILTMLRRHPAVRFAEPNSIYRKQQEPIDPQFGSNDPLFSNANHWGMWGPATTPANQYGSRAAEAWAAGNIGSSSIAVGVIDEGIQITHPDLAANIWTNPVEAAGVAGVDDDGNGKIDDLHGWDFYHDDNSVYDGTNDDHGTHVAGTIGAVGGNGAGVAGVNWHVTIVPAKFLGSGGGTAAGAIGALDYLIDLKTRHGLNIVATNNSWGGGASQALLDAIVRAANAQILFVAAAGNSGVDMEANAFYPASYDTTAGAGWDSIISVASITNAGAKSSFSNYGVTKVDLGAPGSSIISTIPPSTYGIMGGTSMATPHVTGAIALYASLYAHASPQKIRKAILDSAVHTPTPSMNGVTVTGGRLNIGDFGGPAPAAPSDGAEHLDATAVSPTQISLAWDDESPNEDGFRIERCAGADCISFVPVAYVDDNIPGYLDGALSPDTLYRYRVAAFNRGGDAPYSNVSDATTQSTASVDANAGVDINVNEGGLVTLDGTQSHHSEDAALTFAWTQIGGPLVTLIGADSSQPTFTAPQVGPSGERLTFKLTATADGSTGTDTMDVIVLNVNAAPVITSAAPLTATEDEPYLYTAVGTDPDGDSLTWSIEPSHTCGGTIDPATGEFTFTPAGPVPPASCEVALRACDGAEPNLCAVEITPVTILAVNDPPAITSSPDHTAIEDVAFTYAATSLDADGPSRAWSLLPAHTCGGSIDADSGLFTFTPAGPVPPASCVVALHVCDGATPDACASQVATVAIVAVNDAPSLTPPASITTEATGSTGAVVSFAAAGSDPEDGSLAALCAPASGSLFPIGTTTVSCTVTDSSGAAAFGSFTVTVNDPSVPGEMNGDGFIRGDDARYQFSFRARERASGSERARLSVRIDENGRKKGKKRDDRFESRAVDFMMFSDDPTIRPGKSRKVQIDTVLFRGAGEWNGRGGYRYEVTAQDAGEPGRHRESIRVTITSASGDVVASFEGELDGGNIRSERIRH